MPGRPNSAGSNGGPEGGTIRGAVINTDHWTMGVLYQVEAAAVHEVFESYGLLMNGNVRAEGEIYDNWHRAAIKYAEDPALLGAGLPSRTARTLPGQDQPYLPIY